MLIFDWTEVLQNMLEEILTISYFRDKIKTQRSEATYSILSNSIFITLNSVLPVIFYLFVSLKKSPKPCAMKKYVKEVRRKPNLNT